MQPFQCKGREAVKALAVGLLGGTINLLAIHLVQLRWPHPGTGGLAHVVWKTLSFVLFFLGFRHSPLPPPSETVKTLFHIVVGMIMAWIYAVFFYSRLTGPPWLRGLIFVQIPFLIQVLVILPLIGAEILGLKLGLATPFLVFILNAIYGLILGAFYVPCSADTKISR